MFHRLEELDEAIKVTRKSFLLPGGVMVAQLILVQLVMVRIHAGQPILGKSFYAIRS